MAHLLTPTPTTAATSVSTRTRKSPLYSWKNSYLPTPRVCCVGHNHQSPPDLDQVPPPHDDHCLRRRTVMGLCGAVVLGLSLSDEQSASRAARPPPPPPREKKDPNVSGVQAKVLASKRRKEAMKEEVARLRERGKPVNNGPPPLPPPPSPAPQ
ncbi:hypothetical protein Fmac_006174 [Flemingia macrophylla]|uniref:Uncharacterized protein n=1 Tax=Flemingia macrophylla TaxID=520843 RepID=A0ABD1N9U4_9FABA